MHVKTLIPINIRIPKNSGFFRLRKSKTKGYGTLDIMSEVPHSLKVLNGRIR